MWICYTEIVGIWKYTMYDIHNRFGHYYTLLYTSVHTLFAIFYGMLTKACVCSQCSFKFVFCI